MQNERRSYVRVPCFAKCLLYHKGSKYSGVLEDISKSGALVRAANNSLPYIIQLGDRCNLVYCDDNILCPDEFSSVVVRLSSPEIGLQFDLPGGV
jgi:c-di-GMP-binding flagellar brake protein YcgR